MMNELADPIPIIQGSTAFNCPDCGNAMFLHEAIPTPFGAGIGVWKCTSCNLLWSEDGDDWLEKGTDDG